MTLLQSILLGIIQGLTEFLPVSSSAHLVLVPYLLGWKIPAAEAFIFNIFVQVASLVAVVAYFWRDLTAIAISMVRCLIRRKPFEETAARTGWLLVLATIPAGLIGLTLKDLVEKAFSNPQIVAVFLLVTAVLLITAERLSKRIHSQEEPGWKDALWIGLAQALAIFPGISRSGSTITGGMLRGLSRPAAARFAFLMSIPILLAAGLAAGTDLLALQGNLTIPPEFYPGLLASAIVSYLSIRWLLGYITHRPLYIFAAYCSVLAAIVLIFSALG